MVRKYLRRYESTVRVQVRKCLRRYFRKYFRKYFRTVHVRCTSSTRTCTRCGSTEVLSYYRTVQCCNFERRSYLKLSSPKVSVALYFRKCAEPSKIHVLPYMRIRRYGSAEVRKHESTSKGTSVVDSTVHCVRVHYTVHVVYSIFIQHFTSSVVYRIVVFCRSKLLAVYNYQGISRSQSAYHNIQSRKLVVGLL